MTLTKADIIESIRSQNDMTEKQSTELVETMIEILKSTLESGEDVLISGFGKLRILEKAERRGRNPATGDGMMQPTSRGVSV